MSKLPKDRGINDVNLHAEVEPALRPTQSLTVIVSNGKREDMKNKMHIAIVLNKGGDCRAHTAEVTVVDAKCDIEGRFH